MAARGREGEGEREREREREQEREGRKGERERERERALTTICSTLRAEIRSSGMTVASMPTSV